MLCRKLLRIHDHDIVRVKPEQNLTALRPVGTRTQRVAEIAFDHTDDGFDLPPLATLSSKIQSLQSELARLQAPSS